MGWVVRFELTYTGATTQGLRPLDDTHHIKLATRTRLELVTSSVTGWHSNQLNYRAAKLKKVGSGEWIRTIDKPGMNRIL